MELQINPIFRDFLPPLPAEQLDLLKADILQRGVQDKIKVWRRENVIVDGHHRYAIAKEHGLPFEVEYMDFGEQTDVLMWMLRAQSARRNLHWRTRVSAAFKTLKLVNEQEGISIDPPIHRVAALSGVSQANCADHIWYMEHDPDLAARLEAGERVGGKRKAKEVEQAIGSDVERDYGKDATGQKIPNEKVANAFVMAKSEMAAFQRDADKLFGKLIAFSRSPYAAYLTADEVERLSRTATDIVKRNTPYCVCVTCTGSGVVNDSKCKDCGGFGWWNRARFTQLAPQEFKNRVNKALRKRNTDDKK